MQVLRRAAPLFATATAGTVQMSIEAIISTMDLRIGVAPPYRRHSIAPRLWILTRVGCSRKREGLSAECLLLALINGLSPFPASWSVEQSLAGMSSRTYRAVTRLRLRP